MKYQLVLQWPASSIEDYDAIIELEEALIEKLGDESEVDGHDAGSNEVNIFIHTDNPKRTFEEVKAILDNRGSGIDVRIAYREVAGNEYTILWPNGLTEFKVA